MIKIATWNVNSVKARTEHLLKWLDGFRPDIVLLQELKVVDEAFPSLEVGGLGYNVVTSGQKTYNGVAILSKFPIDLIENRLPGEEEDEQARYIEAFTGPSDGKGVRVASIYLPNGNPIEGGDGPKFQYKLRWMERLYNHTQEVLKSEDATVFGGDYNVIPHDTDCYDPEGFKTDALFRPESRKALRKLINLGLTDGLEALNDVTGRYTWWDYRGGGWQKDHGVRIDHLLLSPQAADRLTASGIDKTPRGWEKPSDHTPVWCELES